MTAIDIYFGKKQGRSVITVIINTSEENEYTKSNYQIAIGKKR